MTEMPWDVEVHPVMSCEPKLPTRQIRHADKEPSAWFQHPRAIAQPLHRIGEVFQHLIHDDQVKLCVRAEHVKIADSNIQSKSVARVTGAVVVALQSDYLPPLVAQRS